MYPYPKRLRTVKGSCWQCKDRRVICDLNQPACSRCHANNQVCEYGEVRLRWGNGVASRGPLAGKNVPIRVPAMRTTAPSLILDAGHYMLYFEHALLPRFHLLEDVVKLDLHSLSDDPILLQSVTALSVAHHTAWSRNDTAENSLYKNKARTVAIEAFRKLLADAHVGLHKPQISGPVSYNDPYQRQASLKIFTSNVLLCILDGMVEPGNETAAAYDHLRGGKAILDSLNCVDELLRLKTGVPVLMLSIFASMDLTHSLLSGDAPYFNKDTWRRFTDCETCWGVLNENDSFFQIMVVFSQMASLGHQARIANVHAPISELLAIQLKLERCREMPQREREQLLSLEGQQQKECWHIFSTTYRYAALIYMYRVLCCLPLSHNLIQEAVTAGVHAICNLSLSLNDKLSHCVLFPTLIIGCHCTDRGQRQSMRHTVLSSRAALSFGSVETLDTFLGRVWESDMENSWWDLFRPVSRRAFIF